MNPLIDDLIEILKRHSAVKSVRIVNYDETPAGKIEAKLRCRLVRDYHMQVWFHHEPAFQDYACQLFTDHPILRWDNAPHYPNISTAPHHFWRRLYEQDEHSTSGRHVCHRSSGRSRLPNVE